MKPPILLHCSDGMSWWPDPAHLQRHVESPEIEASEFKVWDTEGQRLSLTPEKPVVRHKFLGIESVSVSGGILADTGLYEPDVLCDHLKYYLEETLNRPPDPSAGLAALLQILFTLQKPNK